VRSAIGNNSNFDPKNPYIRFSQSGRKPFDDPTKEKETSPDALCKMLGIPGYSQRPRAATMRNVGAAQRVRNELDALSADFARTIASVNDQGLLAFRMPEGRK
jgi:hypothetical protein